MSSSEEEKIWDSKNGEFHRKILTILKKINLKLVQKMSQSKKPHKFSGKLKSKLNSKNFIQIITLWTTNFIRTIRTIRFSITTVEFMYTLIDRCAFEIIRITYKSNSFNGFVLFSFFFERCLSDYNFCLFKL